MAPVARGPSTTRIDGAEEKARGGPAGAGAGGGGGGGRVLDLIHRNQSPLCWNEDGMKCGRLIGSRGCGTTVAT